MPDPPKNWDSLAALDCVLGHTGQFGRVLDAGGELYAVILPWLFLYGYRRLEGINLAFESEVVRGSIRYRRGDITRTPYPDEYFDAITRLSVVEHGVELEAYFREMSRILKTGGLLITSTDFWESPVDTGGQRMYGVPVHIFTPEEINQGLGAARGYGAHRSIGSHLSRQSRALAEGGSSLHVRDLFLAEGLPIGTARTDCVTTVHGRSARRRRVRANRRTAGPGGPYLRSYCGSAVRSGTVLAERQPSLDSDFVAEAIA